MLNVFRRHYINRALLPAILASFTLTYAVPLPAQQFQFNLGLNEIAFMVRMEKLVEKLVKAEGKGIDKMVEYLVDIKNEVETSCNVKINVDKFMDDVGSELKKKGQKAPKKEFDAIKKKIKSRDKKHKGHAHYLANVMHVEGYTMNELDEEMFVNDYMMKASKHDKDKDKDEKEEIVLPSLLVYGVTISLCGLFLMCIPIPACKDWGSKMVVAGVTACANSLCSENDKNKDKDKDKK